MISAGRSPAAATAIANALPTAADSSPGGSKLPTTWADSSGLVTAAYSRTHRGSPAARSSDQRSPRLHVATSFPRISFSLSQTVVGPPPATRAIVLAESSSTTM